MCNRRGDGFVGERTIRFQRVEIRGTHDSQVLGDRSIDADDQRLFVERRGPKARNNAQ